MVRRAERARAYQTRAAVEHSGDAVDLGRLQASSNVSGGRMVGMRLASMVLPEPGGPIIRMLCPPAHAISRARLAVCCPRTSLKSTKKCCDSPQQGVAVSLHGHDAVARCSRNE